MPCWQVRKSRHSLGLCCLAQHRVCSILTSVSLLGFTHPAVASSCRTEGKGCGEVFVTASLSWCLLPGRPSAFVLSCSRAACRHPLTVVLVCVASHLPCAGQPMASILACELALSPAAGVVPSLPLVALPTAYRCMAAKSAGDLLICFILSKQATWWPVSMLLHAACIGSGLQAAPCK